MSYVYTKDRGRDRNRRERESERGEGNPFISSNTPFVRFPGGFKRISSRADDGDALNRVDCEIQF